RLLAHQHDLADRGAADVRPGQRVGAAGTVDGGRLEQLPAVEDRLRVDPRRAAAGRLDLEVHVRRDGLRDGADAAEDRAGAHARAGDERLEHDVLLVESELTRDVRLEGFALRKLRLELEELLRAA